MNLDLADLIINNSEKKIITTLKDIIKNNNIDLNQLDRFGFRPLIEAVICNKPAVLSYLLKIGAKVDQVDVLGKTALQWAVYKGYINLCKILLDHKADPNHFSLDGQPILVYPILRSQLEIIELLKKYKADPLFAQDFISAKLLGHRFELTGETDIISPEHKFIPLSFEGFYLEFTVGLIARSLHNFINSIPGQRFSELHSKLYKILDVLKNASELVSFAKHKDKAPFKEEIDLILKEPLLLIPSAYAGHAITFIKYQNKLAKCDRGVNNITDTVIIYEVGNKYLLNDQLFFKLLYEPKTDDFINYEIKHYLSLMPVKALPTRSQIAGNCSFANVETSIPAMLYLLFTAEGNNIVTIEKTVYAFYTAWVEWDKDNALDEIISDFVNASSLERKIAKAVTMSSILVQRCNFSIKKHVERAKKILNILTLPNFQFILRNYIEIYSKESAGNVGKNVMDLFAQCGLNSQNLENIVMYRPINFKKKIQPHDDNIVRMTTALHVACLENNINAVKYILNNLKIDVNYKDRTGSTALMYAAWKGHLDLVKLLVLNYNADLTLKNLKNGTAEKYASYAKHMDVAEFLHKININKV